MNQNPLKIAVVIPFFQREEGILRRALASVMAQDLPRAATLKIVIIDDSSPVPAQQELATVTDITSPHELHVVTQANAGPGMARNAALDMLDPSETPFVAFLDSDDEWGPDHIATALEALDRGHDFYFCDHVRYEKDESWLEGCEVARGWLDGTRLPSPLALNESGDLFSIGARDAFDGYMEEYLSQTSTVVYHFGRHPKLRFDADLRSAGEDYLFWLTLIHESRSVAFSTRKNVTCGRGVNIYFSAFDWDSPGAVARNGYLLIFRLKLREFQLNAEQAAKVDRQIADDGQTYAYLLARNAAKGRAPDWALLSKIFRTSARHGLGLPLRLLPMLSKRERDRIAGVGERTAAAG